MELSTQIKEKEFPCTKGGRWLFRDQLSQHPLLLIFFPYAFEPNSVVNLCQIQSRLREFEELGVKVVGICPENIFALNYLALSLSIDYPLISDYRSDLAAQFSLDVQDCAEIGLYAKEAVFLIESSGEVGYTGYYEGSVFAVDSILRFLEQWRDNRQVL